MLLKRAFLELQPVLMKKEANKEKRVIPIDSDRYRYLRFRAIGNMEQNGLNGNYDGFPYEHFEDEETGYGYKSFVGKPAHYNHNSSLGKKGSIGDLPDAYLNKFIYPEDIHTVANLGVRDSVKWADLLSPKLGEKREAILSMPGQKDGAIEVLMRIDTELLKTSFLEPKTREGLQKILHKIDSGQKVYCSMGVNVEYSTCTVCGNKARFANQYCDHLKKGRKGALTIVTANQLRDMLTAGSMRQEWLKHILASKHDVQEVLHGSSNKGVAIRNGEINHKLSFFELSGVDLPAFEQADALEKVASLMSADYREYLKSIRAQVGDNALIDLYNLMQTEGIISTGCQVSW